MKTRFYLFIPLLFAAFIPRLAVAQHYTGIVLDSVSQKPLDGATVTHLTSQVAIQTDPKGYFKFPTNVRAGDLIEVSYIGYVKKTFRIVPLDSIQFIILQPQFDSLEEVIVNTGFYEVPKERATGSFEFIDQRLLNRSVGTDLLSRLEGVSNGLHFDRRGLQGERFSEPELRLRGISTIHSDERPLIVVDGFPYEHDLNSLNPNDVASVTLLKDAAAASIWGARAGNGVIVITTKQGRFDVGPRISFNTNTTLIEKPDLYYNKHFLPSRVVMSIEEERFNRGDYDEQAQIPIPAYVELLIKRRDGIIDQGQFDSQKTSMLQADVRDEALKYLYRTGLNHQYALNVSGGGDVYRYYMSVGHDRNKANINGNEYKRINVGVNNTFKIAKRLQLDGGLWFSRQRSVANGITLSSLSTGSPLIMGSVTPYARLADDMGQPLSIVRDYRISYVKQAAELNLLDWQYRPIDELNARNISTGNSEIRVNSALKYNFSKQFNLGVYYQFNHYTGGEGQTYYSPESYYVRNIVNKLTQPDGNLVLPNRGILTGPGKSNSTSHSGRAQLNFKQAFNSEHEVIALVGSEVRQQVQNTEPGFVLYDYDESVLQGNNLYDYTTYYPARPVGYTTIPAPPGGLSSYVDRFISYYGNASYTYAGKYILSGSARWDASNLFGVKTNQKGTPLWSVGTSWEISKEDFFRPNIFSYLRLRLTHGSSGNVNKSVSAYPVVSYFTDFITKLYIAGLTNVGNPSLRWEQVNTTNFAIDMSTLGGRLKGSFDFYVKNSQDLVGADYMAPSTGIISDPNVSPLLRNMINYADLRTQGVDVRLGISNLTSLFQWESEALMSFVQNKVMHFNTSEVNDISAYFNSPPPVKGQSRDVMYAYPWYGLNPANGLPRIDSEYKDDYAAYIRSFIPETLNRSGVTVPTFFGSLRNTVSFNNISVSALITWKSGYVFRRGYLAPGDEYNGRYHTDYFMRWEQPGDERATDVPAYLSHTQPYVSQSYAYSEALVTKGDHIRLHDIRLSYTLPAQVLKKMPITHLEVYAYAQNLGILWRANNQGLDPDYPNAAYPAPKMLSFGLQVQF